MRPLKRIMGITGTVPLPGDCPRSFPLALFLGVTLALLGFGFDLSNSSIPEKEIQEGGVPIDGIPALDHPEGVSREEGDDYLDPEDRVVGLVIGEKTRAYPLRILNWHKVVNDSLDGRAVVVTYCPLAGLARAFENEVDGKNLRFGVSGKLYKNNLLFYDRETKSLWLQFRGEAVAGTFKGKRLRPVPLVVTSWWAWKNQYPATEVISLNTGFLRDYFRDPYEAYALSEEPMFPAGEIRGDLPAKARVIGVEAGGKAKAYPVATLKEDPEGVIWDRVGDQDVVIRKVPELESLQVTDSTGTPLESFQCYWFAWQAFYPETEVYRA